jgi:hypothetical protein
MSCTPAPLLNAPSVSGSPGPRCARHSAGTLRFRVSVLAHCLPPSRGFVSCTSPTRSSLRHPLAASQIYPSSHGKEGLPTSPTMDLVLIIIAKARVRGPDRRNRDEKWAAPYSNPGPLLEANVYLDFHWQGRATLRACSEKLSASDGALMGGNKICRHTIPVWRYALRWMTLLVESSETPRFDTKKHVNSRNSLAGRRLWPPWFFNVPGGCRFLRPYGCRC